jgi:glycosyltransferase involved in cell wall biosynthesis
MEPKSDQPFLSIIIPVYNQNPELLERALKSAVSQKEAPDYEVIVVDDGSTQTAKTAELCLKYNARFLPLEHQGLSGARDSGILAANGMYISFLDSDDYLSDQFVNFVQQACLVQKFEVIFFGNSSGNLPHYTFQKDRGLVLNTEPEIQRFFNRLDHLNPGVEIRSSWAKAFRKDFLIHNNLLYPRDLECQGEDHIMMLYLSQKVSSIVVYSGYQLYHYELPLLAFPRPSIPRIFRVFSPSLRLGKTSLKPIPQLRKNVRNTTIRFLANTSNNF